MTSLEKKGEEMISLGSLVETLLGNKCQQELASEILVGVCKHEVEREREWV